MIIHRTGNLFLGAPKGAILTHACNCRGVWGSGIAVEFKKRFPNAYERYEYTCHKGGETLLGTAMIIKDGDYNVGCLFTSIDYGNRVSAPATILKATESAMRDLVTQLYEGEEIHMPRINSGRFKVPWEDTEGVLKQTLWKIQVWTPEIGAPL